MNEFDYDPTSLIEDFCCPCNGEGRGTKVETLPSGAHLEEIQYFLNKIAYMTKIPAHYMTMYAPVSANEPKFRAIVTAEDMNVINYDHAMKIVG